MPNRRLLLVTRNFPPLVGGMERLMLQAVRGLRAGHEVELVGPAGCEGVLPDIQASGIDTRPVWRFLWRSLWRALRRARRNRPDWVVAGSGLTAPAAVIAASLSGSKSLVFVHGLDLVVDSRLYRWLFLPFVRRADRVIANSRNTARLAERAGVSAARVRVLHPGVDVGDEAPPSDKPRDASRPLCLFVGRMIERKGLSNLIDQALPQVIQAVPDMQLLVVGDEAPDALEAGDSEPGQCRAAVERHALQQQVRFVGRVSEEQLHSYYQQARALLFPIRDLAHDVEGFGMVALEAAAHGVPTLAFRAGGVADALADGISGQLLPPGDYQGYAQALIALLQGERKFSAKACREFAAGFAWPLFDARLQKILDEPSDA